MISQEQAPGVAAMTASPVTSFTEEEMRRLTDYQRRCDYQPFLVEFGLDPRRLEFARWLIQRGMLSEGMEQA